MKKKRKGKLTRVKIKRQSIFGNRYEPNQSKIALDNLLRQIHNDILEDIEKTSINFANSLYKKIVKGIEDDVLKKEYKDANALIKAIGKVIQKKAKMATIELSVNDAYQNLNRGELIGAKSSGLKTRKRWVTQFDSRTRSWHDIVNYQEKKLDEKFVVPYPGGTDFLDAPKIPPIAPSNFINCRCSAQYVIIE